MLHKLTKRQEQLDFVLTEKNQVISHQNLNGQFLSDKSVKLLAKMLELKQNFSLVICVHFHDIDVTLSIDN